MDDTRPLDTGNGMGNPERDDPGSEVLCDWEIQTKIESGIWKGGSMGLKIALLQLLPEGTISGQLKKGKAACMKAKEMGADIALFPEMWSDGYALPHDHLELEALSIDADSEFVQDFRCLARELQMAIGISFLEKHDPKPLNSIILFDRNGMKRLHYSKVHTCDFDAEKVLSPGDDFYVVDLDIGRDAVKVGSMICFEREFPESARILMLKGAEVILAPNACPMEINRLSALRTRAYENMLAIATCNYPKGQPDCNGHSTVFDGVAWLDNEPGVRDMCIFEAPEEEGVGEVLVSCFALIFSDFNIKPWSPWSWWLVVSFVLMILYEVFWIRYFRSEKTMKDFYSSILGIPVAGATLPVLAFLLLAIYGKNIILGIAVVILGIGHIGIHLMHRREIES